MWKLRRLPDNAWVCQVMHGAIDFCLQDHGTAPERITMAGMLLESVASVDSNRVPLVHFGVIDAVLVLASSASNGAKRSIAIPLLELPYPCNNFLHVFYLSDCNVVAPFIARITSCRSV